MRYELRHRLMTLVRILPRIGLADDAHALTRHMLLGDAPRWLLVSDFGREVLASVAGGLESAEHLVNPRTELGRDVRLASEALAEVHCLLEEERADIERAICGRRAAA